MRNHLIRGKLAGVTTRPYLIATSMPADPAGIALVLHGGASRPDRPAVSPRQLSVLRMIPIAKRIARTGRGQLAVFRLLNRTRGWDEDESPVADANWALDQLADRFDSDLPVALVGHSLGGRAALLTGTNPAVTSVVALAPWLYTADGQLDLAGRRVLFSHGMSDRVADLRIAAAVAEGLARKAQVGFVAVRGAKHAMLRRRDMFDGIAADFVATTLLDRPATGLVQQALAGDRSIVV